MTHTFSLSDVEALARDCLTRCGISRPVATAVAAEVVAAEHAGERSHGLEALLRDLRLFRYGRLMPEAGWKRSRGPGAVLRINARHGFAAAALGGSRDELADLAAVQGIAILHLRRASAPGLMLATLTALRDRGLIALSLNEAGEARLSDPSYTSPRSLRGLTASPLMALLGLAPPAADAPLGDLVSHRGWIVAADPAAIGPVSQALGPQTGQVPHLGDAPDDRRGSAAGQITLPAELLEQIVNA